MIISDLEYLEVVREENQVEGGLGSVAGSVASASASGTNYAFFSISTSSSTSITETFFPLFPLFPRSLAYAFSRARASASAG